MKIVLDYMLSKMDIRGFVYILIDISSEDGANFVKIGKSKNYVKLYPETLCKYRVYATLQTKEYNNIKKNMSEIFKKYLGRSVKKKRYGIYEVSWEDCLNCLVKYANSELDDSEILGPEFYFANRLRCKGY